MADLNQIDNLVALLDGYVEDYFASLTEVWSARSIELASRVVGGLYPGHQDAAPGMAPADHPVVQKSVEWLELHPDAPAALRRIIIEQQDQLLRSLRVQAAGL